MSAEGAGAARSGTQIVLLTLAAGQFLMTLDSSVMNVSIATVAKDVGTTVTGIQGAITAYTLVMAALMITGGKIGGLIGRKRAFAIGCVIYGAGSFTTSLAPNLPVLLFGWSFLEGVGAALILPAIVALVAGNFPVERRPAAYGLVAAAGAVAVAVGPLIGGFATTYFSWRWVFAGEVVVVIAILLLTRRIADAPVETRPKFDLVGAVLSAAGLALLVFGILRSGEWGWIRPHEGGPSWAHLSPTVWLVLAGLFVIWLFFTWENRREARGQEPLIRPAMLKNTQLSGGLIMFFFQYLVQAGFFFVVPLFLSVCLGLSALATGVRLLPLSVTLLAAAIGIPRFFPHVSPRLVVRIGLLCLLAGTVVLLAALDADAGAGGRLRADAPDRPRDRCARLAARRRHGVGGLRRPGSRGRRHPEHDDEPRRLDRDRARRLDPDRLAQLGVPDEHRGELGDPLQGQVGGHVQLAGGVPFISDADLEDALEVGARERPDDRCRPRRLSRRPDHRAALRARDPRRDGDPLAVLRAADPDQAARGALSAVFQKARGVSSAGRAALGERLGGFIYGTILSLAVLVGGVKAYPHDAWKIVVLLAVTAVVFWLAHVYADSLAHVVAQDRHLSLAELRRIGRHESSILEAALPPLAPMLLAAFGADLDQDRGVDRLRPRPGRAHVLGARLRPRRAPRLARDARGRRPERGARPRPRRAEARRHALKPQAGLDSWSRCAPNHDPDLVLVE